MARYRVRTGIHENNPPVDLTGKAPANTIRVINESAQSIDRTTARVKAIRAAGLEPLPCFITHAYYVDDAAFEAAFRRYVTGIAGYSRWVEVGNEPRDLDEYLRRLAIASPIAREAGLKVILSAFVGWSGGFPAAAAALDSGPHASWSQVDYVATHPYRYTPAEVEKVVWDVRHRLDARSEARGKHILITEIGWPAFTGRFLTRWQTWTESDQAANLQELLRLLLPQGQELKLCLVGAFCHRDYGNAAATHWGSWCGMIDRAGRERPALAVMEGTPPFTPW